MVNNNVVGGWATYPSEKWGSSSVAKIDIPNMMGKS